METKQCTKCQQTKTITEFYKSKSNTDGYFNQCKSCKQSYEKQRWNDPKIKIKKEKAHQEYYVKNRRSILETQSKYVKSEDQRFKRNVLSAIDPLAKAKQRAHTKVRTAFLEDKIHRSFCEQCGALSSEIDIHFHHKDLEYKEENDLDVVKLCRKCHAIEHQKLRKQNV